MFTLPAHTQSFAATPQGKQALTTVEPVVKAPLPPEITFRFLKMPSIRSSIASLSSRLSSDKPLPRPAYYVQMNPEEQMLWEIIGEQTHEYYFNQKGKICKRRLVPLERATLQRKFYESRVGHAIVGDEWMRKKLPHRRHR